MTAQNSANRPTSKSATFKTVSTHDETTATTGEGSTSSTVTTLATAEVETNSELDDSDTDKQAATTSAGKGKQPPSYDAMNLRLPGGSAMLDGIISQQLCRHKMMNILVKYIAVPDITKHLNTDLSNFGDEFADAHRVYFDVVNGAIYVEGNTAQVRFAAGLTQAWGRRITADHADMLLKVIANYYDRAVTWWLSTNSDNIALLDEAIGNFFGSRELEARLRNRMTSMAD